MYFVAYDFRGFVVGYDMTLKLILDVHISVNCVESFTYRVSFMPSVFVSTRISKKANIKEKVATPVRKEADVLIVCCLGDLRKYFLNCRHILK